MATSNTVENSSEEFVPEDVQGNILRGFRSLRMCYVLIRFPADTKQSRAWIQTQLLAADAPLRLTTAASQKAPGGGPLVNFSLTASGLQKLGCPEGRLAAMDPAFQRGMRAEETRSILNDLPADEWSPDYQRPWDGLLVVAFDPAQISDVRTRIEAACAPLAAHLIELGNVLDGNGRPIEAPSENPARFEPFGYRDNMSVSVFTAEHAKELELPDKPVWDPRRPVSFVLAPDPLSANGRGSYFVYRKLRQDVNGFRRRVEKMADVMVERGTKLNELYGGSPSGPYGIFAAGQTPTRNDILTFVKARIMGRAPDGSLPSGGNPANHDFDYAHDRAGTVCPYSGHVRSMNPRGGSGDVAAEKKRGIARRGVPYGRSDAAADPARDCGLLFLCAQSDIGGQFERIQQEWANSAVADFNREPVPMADNVIGRPPAVRDASGYKTDRYHRYTETIEADFSISDLVTLQGGEYLFAPSRSGLEALVSGGLS
jgi:deferrochelatase/peroxidase EfeB